MRLFILGIDGVSWNILEPMVETGKMPFLRELVTEYRTGVLMSTDPPITSSAWISLHTGSSPREHKIRGFKRLDLDGKRLSFSDINSLDIPFKTIWELLGEGGKRVCLVNAPFTYPPFEVNGIVVSGFPLPDDKVKYTYPTHIKEELLEAVSGIQGAKTVTSCATQLAEQGDLNGIQRLEDALEANCLMAEYLMNKEAWDVFVCHIQESDLLQHPLWHLIDRSHEQHSPSGFARVGEFYSRLDSVLRRLTQKATSEGYGVIIMSDHGFVGCRGVINLNCFLYQRGFLAVRKGSVGSKVFNLGKRVIRFRPIMKLAVRLNNRARRDIDIQNYYIENVIDLPNSVCIAESNGTGQTFLHCLGKESCRHRELVDELGNLKTQDGESAVSSIEEEDAHTLRVDFVEGIVSSGYVVGAGDYFSRRVVGRDYQIGVHKKAGIVACSKELDSLALPQSLTDISELVARVTNVKLSKLQIDRRGHVPFTGPEDRLEREAIDNQLRNLGYL